MKLFMYVIIAKKQYHSETYISYGAQIHKDEEEASSAMDEKCIKDLPISKGWTGHEFHLMQIVDDIEQNGRKFKTLVEIDPE